MLNQSITFTSPHKLTSVCAGDKILVALSGGADSCALLHLLREYGEQFNIQILACHVNHGIRTEAYGNEALRDESFCRELCKRLGVKLFVMHTDIPSLMQNSGLSLETLARQERYKFFAHIMRDEGITVLATAHNADDNLETQIFNLSRGCGIDGICGIPEVRSFPEIDGGVIIRPLLKATKSQIIDYCNQNNLGYVTDSTNLVPDCTRNAIRLNIIPELVALFGNPQKASMRLSESARQDCDFIEDYAKKVSDGWNNKIPIDIFNSLHPSIKKRVLMQAFEKISNASLENIHINNIISLAYEGRSPSFISLPDKKRAAVIDKNLIFEDDTRDKPSEKSPCCQRLMMGLNVIGNGEFAILIDSCDNNLKKSICHNELNLTLYSCAFVGELDMTDLCAKKRCGGEVIMQGGMNKKIKKLMSEHKIPLRLRDETPMICRGDEVIYVPDCAICDSLRSDEKNHKYKIAIYQNTEVNHDAGH